MVKNLHFCTEGLLKRIHTGKSGLIIETFRTGFVPTIYSGDVINLNEKDPNKKDKFIRQGRVQWVLPLQYKEFETYNKLKGHMYKWGLIEIKRYNRKFHPDHWFFQIGIKLI